MFCGSNPFLHHPHFSSQCWLVPHCRRHTAKKCGHLGTRLCKTENIIDKKQDIPTCSFTVSIPEIFGKRQACQGNPCTCSRRLVHLSVNKCYLGIFKPLKVHF